MCPQCAPLASLAQSGARLGDGPIQFLHRVPPDAPMLAGNARPAQCPQERVLGQPSGERLAIRLTEHVRAAQVAVSLQCIHSRRGQLHLGPVVRAADSASSAPVLRASVSSSSARVADKPLDMIRLVKVSNRPGNASEGTFRSP